MLHLAEVAPAGGAAVGIEALTGLLILCGLIVALGLIKMVDGFVRALFGTLSGSVGWIPYAGKVLKAPIHKIEQKVTNFLGAAEQGIDHAIGWTWHNMAHLIRWTIREIEAISYALLVASIASSLHISRKRAAELIQAVIHPIRAYQHILRRLHALEHAALHALRHIVLEGVYPRIHAGEATLDHVIEWDIPRLRARERALARRVERLWKWSRAHAKPIATGAFVAAVAISLRRMGLGWLRCRNVKRFGRAICGLNAPAFDALLAGLVGAYAIADYRDLVRDMQKVERAAAKEVIDLLHAFD